MEKLSIHSDNFIIEISFNPLTKEMSLYNPYIKPELMGVFTFHLKEIPDFEIASASFLNIEDSGIYLVAQSNQGNSQTRIVDDEYWIKCKTIFKRLQRKYVKGKSHLPKWW